MTAAGPWAAAERLPVVGGPLSAVDGWLDGIRRRGRRGSLDDRDAAFIERQMRWLGPITDFYFRGEVRHLERIPESGPVLMIANHSGGLVSPDIWVLEVNYMRHFGTRRETHALVHDMVLGTPLLGGWLRHSGSVPAAHRYARAALRRGAAVLVYPGGDEELFRPFSERNRIRLSGRTGFIRLALAEDVPIVPVVSVGGHESLLVLGGGRWLARTLHLERFRIKSLPLVVAAPWGISPGDLLLHLPLPAKVTIECGRPIRLRDRVGGADPEDRDAVWACYRHVEGRMQSMLDRLASERRLPVVG